MRKFGKGVFLLMLLGSLGALLCGCQGRGAKSAPVRYVTQVDVRYRNDRQTITRRYTSQEKISSVLNYLRCLRGGEVSDDDPERIAGDVCRITLRLSDGTQRVYLQRADRYLSRDSHPWTEIDPKRGRELLPILEELESDPES